MIYFFFAISLGEEGITKLSTKLPLKSKLTDHYGREREKDEFVVRFTHDLLLMTYDL
jgi:hypothetical protein